MSRERRPIFPRQAQQFADDRERKWTGQTGHKVYRLAVAAKLCLQIVEHLMSDRLESWTKVLDAAPEERVLDQPTQPPMIGLVAIDHRFGHCVHRTRQPPRHRGPPRHAGRSRFAHKHLTIAEQLIHGLVGRRHPELADKWKLDANHRPLVDHSGQSRIGISLVGL